MMSLSCVSKLDSGTICIWGLCLRITMSVTPCWSTHECTHIRGLGKRFSDQGWIRTRLVSKNKIKIKGIKILILKVVNCRIFFKSFIWGSLLCLSLVSPLMKSLLRVAERKSNLYQNWCKHEFFVCFLPKFKFWKSFFPWFFCHQNIMCFEL